MIQLSLSPSMINSPKELHSQSVPKQLLQNIVDEVGQGHTQAHLEIDLNVKECS